MCPKLLEGNRITRLHSTNSTNSLTAAHCLHTSKHISLIKSPSCFMRKAPRGYVVCPRLCTLSVAEPGYNLWLPDSRAHLHHEAPTEMSRKGKMTKRRGRTVLLFKHSSWMGKLMKETSLRRLRVKYAVTLLGVSNSVIRGIPNIFKTHCQLLGKIQEIHLFDFISFHGILWWFPDASGKNVSPWSDIKAFWDPVSFIVSTPVACSQAFLNWPHAISVSWWISISCSLWQ